MVGGQRDKVVHKDHLERHTPKWTRLESVHIGHESDEHCKQDMLPEHQKQID